MKQFAVSLDIVTSVVLNEEAVVKLFGLGSAELSSGTRGELIYWRYEREGMEGASLIDQIHAFVANVNPSNAIEINENIKGIVMTIAVFFDTATCTIAYPAGALSGLLGKIPGLEVEIVGYPVKEDDL